MKLARLALSLCLVLPVLAQQPTPPRVIALKAARLFDGTTNDIVKNAVVLVEGTRIKAIGGAIPTGAEVIDLGDVTLLPGFIDAHTHLAFESGDNYYRDYFESLMRHPAEQALLATTYARKTIDAGVTTVRDVGSGDYIDISLRNAIAAGSPTSSRFRETRLRT